MDTTEKNRVVKSKDAFDKKEVIIMSKKRSLKMLLVIIMAVATISEGLTLTWGNEFSDGEEIISDAGEETVSVSEELFSSGVSEENSVEADVPVATASYNNNWRCWNQGQSDYADMEGRCLRRCPARRRQSSSMKLELIEALRLIQIHIWHGRKQTDI